MTNGEKLKEIFPNIDNRLDDKTGIMIVKWVDNTTKFFKTSWWNSEYKESCEDWYDVPSDEMTLEQARQAVKDLRKKLTKYLNQEPKIKVLERDEAIRKLGAVDIYQASAWITLLDDLEYLGLKICEVES